MSENESTTAYLRLIKFFGLSNNDKTIRREEYDIHARQNTASSESVSKRKEIMLEVLKGIGYITPEKPKLPTSEEKKKLDAEHAKNEQAKHDESLAKKAELQAQLDAATLASEESARDTVKELTQTPILPDGEFSVIEESTPSQFKRGKKYHAPQPGKKSK